MGEETCQSLPGLSLGGSGEYHFEMHYHPLKLDGCRRACVKAGCFFSKVA